MSENMEFNLNVRMLRQKGKNFLSLCANMFYSAHYFIPALVRNIQ